MSVDVFGRHLNHAISSRGPPGIGYKITEDGQFDVENRRLCNVAIPIQPHDVTDLYTVEDKLQSLREDINNKLSTLKTDVEKSLEVIRKDIKDLQALKKKKKQQ